MVGRPSVGLGPATAPAPMAPRLSASASLSSPLRLRIWRQPPPRSCDTFVYVAGEGGPACTLFGKNSDRPSDEAHEVVYFPPAPHPDGSTVRCTYIDIPQAAVTHAVVLSRPAWLWGCEMGANEHGVVGGNEAVSSVLRGELGSGERLLGMDLLRLALERSRTAADAVEVCTQLLEAHGQGGGCAEGDDWTYENGFIFADSGEAFVLETAGVRHWACERVAPGTYRNISNGLSIRTQVHSCSAHVKDACRARGWWDGTSPFDWKRSVGHAGRAHANLQVCGREAAGLKHLRAMSTALQSGELRPDDAPAWLARLAGCLRDEQSGICFRDLHGFCSTGSQLSWISNPAASASHLFTGASDPALTAYKCFRFSQLRAGAERTDFRTRALWLRWRELALAGGLDQELGASDAAGVKEEIRQVDDATMQSVVSDSQAAAPSFAAVVAQQLRLLKSP